MSRHRRLGYTEHSHDGPPVLMIMGFGMRGDAWRRQSSVLAEHYRVVTFDHAGIGDSDPVPTRRLTMSDLVADTVSILDMLGWSEAHIIGISMGGMVAQNLALQHPDRVLSLALVATHAGGVKRGLPPLEGIKRFILSNVGSQRMDSLAKLLFPPEYLAHHKEAAIQSLREDFRDPPPPETRLAQLHAVSTHRAAPHLHKISAPTLVVKPEKDILIHPHCSDELVRLIPGAVLETIPDAGHGIVRQTPDALNSILLEFLNSMRTERS